VNDCLVFAVDYVVRYSFFMKREQVKRLYKEKFYLSEQKAIDNKKKQGYPLAIFNDFGEGWSQKLITVLIDA
jgi:hypothetical protein